MTPLSRMARGWLPAVLAAILAVAVFTPVQDSAVRGDDSHVITDIAGHKVTAGLSDWDVLSEQVDDSFANGRPQPIGTIEGTLTGLVVGDGDAYKWLLIVMSLACVAALVAFLRMFSLPRGTVWVAVVALAASLQFRAVHDPVLGYYTTPQFIVLVLLAGLTCYLRFLRGGPRGWYAATVALVLVLLWTYEAAQPLVLAYAALHLGRDAARRRSRRWVVPLLGLGFAMFLFTTYEHGHVTAPAGYEASLDPILVVLTAAREAVSSIPTIYFLSGAQGLLQSPTKAEALAASWRAALGALVVTLALLAVRRGRTPGPSGEAAGPREGGSIAVDAGDLQPVTAPLIGIGLVMIVCSGLYIALAQQWQQNITLGGGHLATFTATIGFATLVAGLWAAVSPRIRVRPLVLAFVALGVFGVLLAGQYTNMRVVAVERPGVEQRDLLGAGLEQGLLRDVKPGTTVFLAPRDLNSPFGNLVFYGGTADYFLLLRTGRRYDVRTYAPGETPDCGPPLGFPVKDCARKTSRNAFISVRASRFGRTIAVAYGIRRTGFDAQPSAHIVALAQGQSARGPAPSLAGYRPDGSVWSADTVPWRREVLDDEWVRYSAKLPDGDGPTGPSLTDPRSTVDFGASKTPGQVVRIFGTKDLLP